ncbi:MAG TPA: hypothetical protein VJC18_06605 [bacterium]|nr:hypothetical protein [bacterium]
MKKENAKKTNNKKDVLQLRKSNLKTLKRVLVIGAVTIAVSALPTIAMGCADRM